MTPQLEIINSNYMKMHMKLKLTFVLFQLMMVLEKKSSYILTPIFKTKIFSILILMVLNYKRESLTIDLHGI